MKRFVFAALLIVSNLALGLADEVTTVDHRGKVLVRKGTIVDYKGDQLTLRVSGKDTAIGADTIRQIEADWLPEHVQANVAYRSNDFNQALGLYRQAFLGEKRRWVQRLLLARVVRCQTNTGRVDDACKNFARLVADDPRTVYFDAIPLTWQNRQTPANVVQRVSPWLKDSARPTHQLIAASWLLNSSQHSEATRTLRGLGRNESKKIASLAVSQLWRGELRNIKEARLTWWQQHVEAMPEELRAGSYLLLGRSYKQHQKTDDALLALLRIPTLYNEDIVLGASALADCGALF